MTTHYSYYKNSNTGELIKKVTRTESPIKWPDYFYDIRGHELVEPSLVGFVEISEKKWNRLKRKTNEKRNIRRQ